MHRYDCDSTQEGWLVTRELAIPATGVYVLEFWSANEYPYQEEHYSVWVSTTSNDPASLTFVEVKHLSGAEISDRWKKIIVSLEAYAGQSIYIGFKYEGNCADLWYIDDVTVLDLSSYVDGEVAAILSPNSGENLTANEEVKVLLKNNGGNFLTDFSLSLEFDGTPVATETFTDTIKNLGQAEYTFAAKLNLSNFGGHEIKVSINVQNDEDADNDIFIKKAGKFRSEPVTLYGFILEEVTEEDYQMGFYSFSSATPQNITQLSDGTEFIRVGEYLNDYFYGYIDGGTGFGYDGFMKISTDTWDEVSTESCDEDVMDMAYDYSTQTMYGIEYNELFTIDMETGESDYIDDMETGMISLACSLDGQLYGIDYDGYFYSIDKRNASIKEIANTGIEINISAQTMAFDHNTGRLFWVYYDYAGAKLIEIDPSTGTVFDRGNIGTGYSMVTGLFTKYKHPVNVTSYEPENRVKIYPNPAKSQFTVTNVENASLYLYNIVGQEVFSTYSTEENTVVNVNSLPQGVYVLKVVKNGVSSVCKIVISD
jgi:hypothetical protein